MHKLLLVLSSLALASCATRPYTATSPETRAAKKAYTACFDEAGALLASNTTDPAEALAKAVARKCYPRLQAFQAALHAENAGGANPEVYAAAYAGALQKRHIEEAAHDFMTVRAMHPRK